VDSSRHLQRKTAHISGVTSCCDLLQLKTGTVSVIHGHARVQFSLGRRSMSPASLQTVVSTFLSFLLLTY
jgi:hypothetical protein